MAVSLGSNPMKIRSSCHNRHNIEHLRQILPKYFVILIINIFSGQITMAMFWNVLWHLWLFLQYLQSLHSRETDS